jgi:putative endonuclease
VRRSRQSAERLGHRAELIALWYLRCKGYRLVAQRYKAPSGEIDLIMKRGKHLAFIEVKARATVDDGIIAVTQYQSRRITAAASHFTSVHGWAAACFCRFDIIAVPAYLWPTHIENAFEGR